jgi:GNAT superfamily N-acetyltransferase
LADPKPPALEFRVCPADEDPAAALLAAMREEMALLYDGLDIDDPSMPAAGAAELGPPGGVFVVGFEQGLPLCGGGVKRLAAGACEIKRIFVVPAARGRGVARTLLAELERRARELGYELARLDSGPRQPGPQRIFTAAGYRPIANFNDNPVATYFGEKRL